MDIALLEGIGRQPVTDTRPAGGNVREDPRFDALQLEISKLSNPGADGQTNWPRVAQLAAPLLADGGKDLLVACYLNAALLQTDGLAGLAAGLQVLGDLIEHFWDGMSPPVARLRARRNALQWLLDRTELGAQERPWSELAPQAPALVAGLRASGRRIDALLRAKDEEAPSMRALLALIDQVPVREEAPAAAPVAAPSGAPSPAASSPAAPTAPSALPALAPIAAPAPGEDLALALAPAFAHLAQVVDALMAADPLDARAYRIGRFANWAGVDALPPATGGMTQIGAPIAQVADAMRRMQDGSAEPLDAIGFAESQFPAFPFWLDLQALSATALARLGDAGAAARAEVERATLALLQRLPGLESLCFGNGMPFASGQTLEWIASLVGSTASAGSTEPNTKGDGLGSVVAQANGLAANGELEAAVALLQQAIARAADAPARLRAQIRLCQLLSQHREGRVPQPFARLLVEQIRHHDLDRWDPALAVEGWVAAHAVLNQDDADPLERHAALSAIARLDAARAIALT
uniref:type VI secretion system protein TssA n=1 Tax=unclassified Variovorax TaxID=663243 RepID=UPI000D345D7D